MAVTKCLYILQTTPWACTIYMYHCSSIKIETFIYIVFYTTVHKYKHCSRLLLQHVISVLRLGKGREQWPAKESIAGVAKITEVRSSATIQK
jgi:hypothetical protein